MGLDPDKGCCSRSVSTLGRVCKLEPEYHGHDDPHSAEAVRQLLISGCQTPVLLEAVDQSFDLIALSVDGFVEWTCAVFVPTPRDSDADTPSAGVLPNGTTAIALVS